MLLGKGMPHPALGHEADIAGAEIKVQQVIGRAFLAPFALTGSGRDSISCPAR